MRASIILRSEVIIFILLLFYISYSCKEEDSPTVPEIKTKNITSVTRTTAVSGGTLTSDGGAEVTTKGICWSVSKEPTISGDKTNEGTGMGDFNSNMTGLMPGITYYVRAYASNSIGTIYGNELSFTTNPAGAPVLTTSAITGITGVSALSGGVISDNGDAEITAKGVCWSETSPPTINDSITNEGSGSESFESQMTGLKSNTKYYVRAYATNAAGTSYGIERDFNTPPVLPVVITVNISNTSPVRATVGGNVTSDGGDQVTEKGVCWGLTNNPDVSGSYLQSGAGAGSFSVDITGLTPGMKYYFRAYAKNSVGIAYGDVLSFDTPEAYPPRVGTGNAGRITSISAEIPFVLDSDGGLTVTAKGICWDKEPNPTIDDNVAEPKGSYFFNVFLKNLDENTTYYFRAYATNAIGTGYSINELSFKTLSTGGTPTITDVDGNVYATVAIGTKLWMRENLKTTKLNDGTSISVITDDETWKGLATPAYCWYNNETDNKNTYGALYNWHAVNTTKLCPAGWRVPTQYDWQDLQTYMGDNENVGGKMMEEGTSHWISTGEMALNSFGFTARPNGRRMGTNGAFFGIREFGNWWTITPATSDASFYIQLSSNMSLYISNTSYKTSGYGIRCVK